MPDPDHTTEALFSFENFLSGAEKNDLFQQVSADIAQEQRETVVCESSVRRDEEWGSLANQIVGRENL